VTALPAPSSGAARLALIVLAVLGLILAPHFTPASQINGDTSWLIHVVERLMAGGRAYVDVVETNPPMAFLVYWPAVATARALDIAPEIAVMVFTGGLAALSILLTLAIARRSLGMTPLGLAVFGAALVVAFVLLPSRTFTQREHLALMLLMPSVTTLATRSMGGRPGLAIALAGGAMAGLGACIKPHFALVVALPAAVAALLRRDVRLLVAPEALISGAIVIAYAALWYLAYPEFFGTPLFLVQNTYRLYVYRPFEYLQDAPAVVFLFAMVLGFVLALVLRGCGAVLTLGAAMLAFALAFVEQGKGFAYHLYPVVAAGLTLAAFAIALGLPERSGHLPPMRGLVFLVAMALAAVLSGAYSARYPDSNGLRQALLLEKPKPSLIIMSYDIAVNFPLNRDIGATWASRLQSTWISNSAYTAIARGLTPEQRARTERAIQIEREWLAEDIRRNQPDVLVFDHALTRDRMREGAQFRESFDGLYAQTRTAQDGRFLIYRRTAP
jgi:hypothetical protein